MEAPKNDNTSNLSTPNWTFGGALLYSLTLLTTVGYVRLSPRTTIGKVVAIIYAIIGVPLMLILLSTLGSLMAGGARKCYMKLSCKQHINKDFQFNVEYHRAPSSPTGRNQSRATSNDDSSLIQLMPTPYQNNINHHYHKVKEEIPKRTVLATVRSSHTRGRCVSNQVRQMLAEPQACLAHGHGAPPRIIHGCAITLSDVEETDDNEENDPESCSHDTPSRIPLIWRSTSEPRRSPSPIPPETVQPPVPATIVLLIFVIYVCIGAIIFATTNGWSFLDATYFCFIALSTISIGDKLPQSADYNAQLQLLVCCLYLFIGLVIVAMCFSLVHDEIAFKCRQFASTMGLMKN